MKKSANISIGRDANGAEINIDIEEFNNAVKQHIETLLQNQGIDEKIDEKLNPLQEQLKDDVTPKISSLQKCQRFIKIFLAVPVVLGIISLCVSLTAFSIDSTAFLGWTMSVLALLVVVLMSWQIFNVLDLKEYRVSFSKIDRLNEDIRRFKVQLSEIKKETATKNRVKDLEQKHKQLHSELLSDIYEAKGIAYENVDAKKSITHYLLAIEIALDEPDKVHPSILIDEISIFLKNRDDAKQAFKSYFILETINRIKKHRNYNMIMREFDNFTIMQLDE
jgi:hypothetical protein